MTWNCTAYFSDAWALLLTERVIVLCVYAAHHVRSIINHYSSALHLRLYLVDQLIVACWYSAKSPGPRTVYCYTYRPGRSPTLFESVTLSHAVRVIVWSHVTTSFTWLSNQGVIRVKCLTQEDRNSLVLVVCKCASGGVWTLKPVIASHRL